jgi:hypothetical protein
MVIKRVFFVRDFSPQVKDFSCKCQNRWGDRCGHKDSKECLEHLNESIRDLRLQIKELQDCCDIAVGMHTRYDQSALTPRFRFNWKK